MSDALRGEPRTHRELFELLQRHGWLTPGLAEVIRQMVGFRNIVVPGPQRVQLQIMRDISAQRLDDLLTFNAAIMARLHA